jgi:hypothetical protein
MEPEEVFKRLDSGADGLDDGQAKQRREETGPNSLKAGEAMNPNRRPRSREPDAAAHPACVRSCEG